MVDTTKLGAAMRGKRGKMSLRQAAEKAGISYPTLSKIENGGEPDLANFMKACKWLGVPMEYFYTEDREHSAAA